MNSINFYKEIKSFNRFSDISNPDNFHHVPEDWFVIISDVKGSTQAIKEGKYKEVNTIGAATIALALKLTKDFDLPFFFGGDGATLITPPQLKDELCKKLLALSLLSKKNFSLDLRIGLVPVKSLYEKQLEIQLGKFEETKGVINPVLKGAGVTEADRWIKDQPEIYQVKESDNSKNEADLTGLSCRWMPIPSSRGVILSLMIKERKGHDNTYADIIQEIESALKGGINAHNPVNLSVMSYRNIIDCINDEKRYHKNVYSFSFLFRFLEILLAVTIFKRGLNPLFFNPKVYASSMRNHSDFKKFDDTLRMTIDCSSAEVEEIKNLLSKKHNAGEIFYGLFETNQALMTCFVDNLNHGGHFHFIDANNGGYAMSAQQLKSQILQAN